MSEGTDRRWAVGLAVAAGVVTLGLGVVVVAGSSGSDGGSAATTAPAPPTTRDLSAVTDEELEAVVAEHPGVVGMRLSLVERYLRAGRLEPAQQHAEEAVGRSETLDDRATALRYLGWTTALLGDPETGEGLLVQSLGLDPADPDSLYFLGRVRFELLEDPAGALVPLEELEGIEMSDEQRRLIDDLLAQVRVRLGVGSTTAAG